MSSKGPPPTYTETCPHCQAVIPVRDVINVDADRNLCPKCGGAYKVPGSEKRQQFGG
jgi:Zn-finger nucleic acid-binding protein